MCVKFSMLPSRYSGRNTTKIFQYFIKRHSTSGCCLLQLVLLVNNKQVSNLAFGYKLNLFKFNWHEIQKSQPSVQMQL